MRLSRYYKYILLSKLLVIFYSFVVIADENLDEKVKNLTLELRCMTCQNQSIHDSDAEFSNDIKKIVRSKFAQGKTEKEIKVFLVERYGEYILFKPLFNYKNLFLWVFPFILLLISLIFFVLQSRKDKL